MIISEEVCRWVQQLFGVGICCSGMETIKIHVSHCGEVHTSPYLPFDTNNAGMLKVDKPVFTE